MYKLIDNDMYKNLLLKCNNLELVNNPILNNLNYNFFEDNNKKARKIKINILEYIWNIFKKYSFILPLVYNIDLRILNNKFEFKEFIKFNFKPFKINITLPKVYYDNNKIVLKNSFNSILIFNLYFKFKLLNEIIKKNEKIEIIILTNSINIDQYDFPNNIIIYQFQYKKDLISYLKNLSQNNLITEDLIIVYDIFNQNNFNELLDIKYNFNEVFETFETNKNFFFYKINSKKTIYFGDIYSYKIMYYFNKLLLNQYITVISFNNLLFDKPNFKNSIKYSGIDIQTIKENIHLFLKTNENNYNLYNKGHFYIETKKKEKLLIKKIKYINLKSIKKPNKFILTNTPTEIIKNFNNKLSVLNSKYNIKNNIEKPKNYIDKNYLKRLVNHKYNNFLNNIIKNSDNNLQFKGFKINDKTVDLYANIK